MVLVQEFKDRALKLEHQVVLRGQSQSTLNNYIRRIALFVIHLEKLPEHVSVDEINKHLVALARDPKAPSRSSFKHMVYGLRYYYRLLSMSKKAIALLHLDLQFVPDEKPDIDQLKDAEKPETASERILRLTGFDVTK